MDCNNKKNIKNHHTQEKDFYSWSDEKLTHLEKLIEKKLFSIDESTIIVLETGHFKLPLIKENFEWAKENIKFCEILCKKIIQKYKRKIKITPVLLLNNLENEHQIKELNIILQKLLQNNKYITISSLKLLKERNLKNRAYNALKKNSKLSDNLTKIDNKVYLKNKEYKHDLAAGFVNKKGDIVPRCGLILMSFLDKITDIALKRLHQTKNIHMIFVSFNEEYFEYERVKLGVDIYTTTYDKIKITPIIVHWGYLNNDYIVSHRHDGSKKWIKEKI